MNEREKIPGKAAVHHWGSECQIEVSNTDFWKFLKDERKSEK